MFASFMHVIIVDPIMITIFHFRYLIVWAFISCWARESVNRGIALLLDWPLFLLSISCSHQELGSDMIRDSLDISQ